MMSDRTQQLAKLTRQHIRESSQFYFDTVVTNSKQFF